MKMQEQQSLTTEILCVFRLVIFGYFRAILCRAVRVQGLKFGALPLLDGTFVLSTESICRLGPKIPLAS
jgi:hypothetical protein